MANTSAIFTDKTGTLAQHYMSIVASSITIRAEFVRSLGDNQAHTNAPDQEQDVTEAAKEPGPGSVLPRR